MCASPTFENLLAAKRERVLREAEDEFAAQGYNGASMNRLARRLGIAKGSLFKYFGNKEGCFRAVFNHAVDGFAHRMRKVRAADGHAGEADRGFFEVLEHLLCAALEFVHEHPGIFRIYLKVLFYEDVPLRRVLLEEVRRNTRRLLVPLIEKGQERGELRKDMDVGTVVFLIEAVCERFLQAGSFDHVAAGVDITHAAPDQVREAARGVLDVMRKGLEAKERGCSKND